MIFDFDDTIWVKDVSLVNQSLSWLKNENKIHVSFFGKHVTCGNEC